MNVYGCPPPSSDAGGVRGSLYSESGGMGGSTLSPTPEQQKAATPADVQAAAAAIAALLMDEGILVLSTQRRLACGTSLAADGYSLDDIRLVIEFMKESEPEPSNQRRYLAGILQDPAKRKEAIENVRKFRSSETKKLSDAEFGAAIRRANQSSVERFEGDWNAYVATRKAAGEPIAGPRDPHPWEVSGPVVKPDAAVALRPDTGAEQKARREQFKRDVREGRLA